MVLYRKIPHVRYDTKAKKANSALKIARAPVFSAEPGSRLEGGGHLEEAGSRAAFLSRDGSNTPSL